LNRDESVEDGGSSLTEPSTAADGIQPERNNEEKYSDDEEEEEKVCFICFAVRNTPIFYYDHDIC
jgi:hypothetical protein